MEEGDNTVLIASFRLEGGVPRQISDSIGTACRIGVPTAPLRKMGNWLGLENPLVVGNLTPLLQVFLGEKQTLAEAESNPPKLSARG